MTRIRRRTDSQDGPAVRPWNRPPAALIPEPFREKFAEYDRLATEAEHAAADLRSLTDDWAILRGEATRADTRAAVRAALTGEPIVATANIAALDQRLENTRAEKMALAGAVEDLADQLNQIRYAEQENPRYRADVTKARAALTKALATAEARATELAQATALSEWVHDQLPWDATVSLPWVPVTPDPSRGEPPTTRLSHIIEAIADL